MGLDYSKGSVNFRDVGECVNLLAGIDLLSEGRLFRGGKLDFVDSAEQISHPGTIINLRKGPDPKDKLFGADYWHFPISNDYEKYNTVDHVVRRWLNDVIACIAGPVSNFPVLFHCTSGKDRTGVVIAAILSILNVDRELIVQEYLWSEGEVERAWIEGAIDGIGEPANYFRRIDLGQVRNKLALK